MSKKEILSMESLPKDVMSAVCHFLKPHDLISLSTVNKSWRNVTTMNSTWRRYLPSNYAEYLPAKLIQILTSSEGELKKFLVSNGIAFRNGSQKIRIDMFTGLPVFYVSIPLGMVIHKEDLRDYWMMAEEPMASLFQKSAFMCQVCGFLISGSAILHLPAGQYSVGWRLSRRKWFTWPSGKVNCRFTVPGLRVDGGLITVPITAQSVAEFPKMSEIEVGRFAVKEEDSGMPLEVIAELFESEEGRWKAGVYFDCLVVKQIK